MWRYKSSKFLIFTSKIHVKFEISAMKNVKPTTKKIEYFWILVFELKLGFSGTLGYNVFLVLFCGKKSKSRMKSKNCFLRKKQWILRTFEAFVVRHTIAVKSSVSTARYIFFAQIRCSLSINMQKLWIF